MLSQPDKVLVYFDDERSLIMRLGAAALACWPELTPHAQRHMMQRATQILDDDEDEAVAYRLQTLIADHKRPHWPKQASDHVAVRGSAWSALLLRAARTLLGMDLAFVSEFQGEDRVICSISSATDAPLLKIGQRIPLSLGYCKKVVDGDLPAIIPDTAELDAAMAIEATRSFPIGAHLGLKLQKPDGTVFGTLCCLSHRPRPDLGEHHLAAAGAMAELLL